MLAESTISGSRRNVQNEDLVTDTFSVRFADGRAAVNAEEFKSRCRFITENYIGVYNEFRRGMYGEHITACTYRTISYYRMATGAGLSGRQ